MGFYLRKSIKVGPLRFNLSKSGVGVSAGVKGFRVGTGPRGNYVHMGMHGVYYRTTIPSSSSSAGTPSGHPAPPLGEPVIPDNTHEPLTEIESADVAEIVDSSSQDLLNELNDKRRKARLWPFALTISSTLVVVALTLNAPAWLYALLIPASVVGIYLALQKDILRKTVVLLYDFDHEMEESYGLLHQWAEQLAKSAKVWHIEAEGRVHDSKYHAGASSLIRRKPTTIEKAHPPYVKTNIETIAIGVGRQTLHLFPDRLLVYDTNGVGAVGYSHLTLTAHSTRFVEDDGVPRDAKVVDHTWQYVNKSGGPDRRFKANRQIPICLYDELAFNSSTGLNEVIQVSRCDIGDNFAKAVRHLAGKLPR